MIKGDLIIKNASNILSISSNTIGSIGGMFELSSLNGLSAIRMDSLRTINELSMVKLTQLRELQFGSEGVTKGTKVTVSDTFLDSLSGLKLASVDILEINNNRRLTKFDSDLVNVTTGIFIVDNGNNIDITLESSLRPRRSRSAMPSLYSFPALRQSQAHSSSTRTLRWSLCSPRI